MTDRLRVLFAGESWTTATTHIKGLDAFTQYGYGEGVQWVKGALERGGAEVVHLPCHKAITDYPQTAAELGAYDCLILSDIGTNTLLLHPETTHLSQPTPNRLAAIAEYVAGGGGLIMIGGYMSYQGIEGKARFRGTPVEEALPVTMLDHDDRTEVPEGFQPEVVGRAHPAMAGLPERFPPMLFFNQVQAKPGATLLLQWRKSPILVVWEYGKGRSAAFTPDAAPHGATPEFLNWEHFDRFWQQLVTWLCGR